MSIAPRTIDIDIDFDDRSIDRAPRQRLSEILQRDRQRRAIAVASGRIFREASEDQLLQRRRQRLAAAQGRRGHRLVDLLGEDEHRRCGGRLRVIAAVTDAAEIARILHGAWPRPSPPGQQAFFLV